MVELTVVSWNTQGRGPERLGLAGALDEWRPDVLLLQEADGDQLGEALRLAKASDVIDMSFAQEASAALGPYGRKSQ